MIADTPIGAAFMRQARACDMLGSSFTARLCKLAAMRLSGNNRVCEMIRAWPHDRVVEDALALRFCGALHALKRQGYKPLKAVYPPETAADDELWQAVCTALDDQSDFITKRMASAPQTNEVRRSAALFPAFTEIAVRFRGMPLVLSEIGTSAGLNLLWDHFAYRLADTLYSPTAGDPPFTIEPEWNGRLPAHTEIAIRERAGCDLNPLRADRPDDCERLLSYIWADQSDRIERTEQALAVARVHNLSVQKEDAVAWLAGRLAKRHENAVHVIYHTIAWQYLPEAAQREGLRLIAEAGKNADGNTPGAALSLTTYPGGDTQALGRADFHGRWVDWQT